MVTRDRTVKRDAGGSGASSGSHEVSFLEQSLWRILTSSSGNTSRDERIAAWLALLSGTLEGVIAAVVVLRDAPGAEFVPVATWPADSQPSAALAAAAETALQTGQGTIVPREGASPGPTSDMALPVLIAGEVRGVIGVSISRPAAEAGDRTFRQLQWGAAWIREILLGDDLEQTRAYSGKVGDAVRLFAVALEEQRFEAACRSLVTLLAEQFGCERVSIGFVRRGYVKAAVISHTAQFSERLNLIRHLGNAMDEAVDQQAYIVYPQPADEPFACRAHEALARKFGATGILTIPLLAGGRFIGAVTFERTNDAEPFSPREIETLEFVASFVALILDEKRANDRPLALKAGASIARQAKMIFGPRYLGRKLLLLAAVAAGAFFTFTTTDYRVGATARIEGSIQRTIAAPFDGLIREVGARPGDVVEEGSRLVALDDRELVLERLRWVTERDKQRSEYDRALGERARSDVRIISMRIAQANAQIELTDEKLARATVAAPFRGVVIAGDLSQRIGGAVRRGETLMEIAPLTSYRVVLNLDESQVEHIKAGSTGDLVVSSLPDTVFPIRLTKIIPMSMVVDGRNVFAAEAEVTGNPENLRPGMTGVAKIMSGERLLIWVWTRSFVDWLRLFAWRWLP